VAVDNFEAVEKLKPVLENEGFYYRYWEGGEDKQMVFQSREYDADKNHITVLTHYIHVGLASHLHMKNYINYRDYMNAVPDEAREYEKLKLRLEREVKDNGDYLVYHPGKGEFIGKMIKKANRWDENGRSV
jgi:GrpB-like predicted nucleotidyltransferase (UPF0157 family)